MNRNNKQKTDNKPFFTRFLDHQELKNVTGSGDEDFRTTLKYPSDGDDAGFTGN